MKDYINSFPFELEFFEEFWRILENGEFSLMAESSNPGEQEIRSKVSQKLTSQKLQKAFRALKFDF